MLILGVIILHVLCELIRVLGVGFMVVLNK